MGLEQLTAQKSTIEVAMFKNTDKRHRFALSLIQAGLSAELVCRAASLSPYEYRIIAKESQLSIR